MFSILPTKPLDISSWLTIKTIRIVLQRLKCCFHFPWMQMWREQIAVFFLLLSLLVDLQSTFLLFFCNCVDLFVCIITYFCVVWNRHFIFNNSWMISSYIFFIHLVFWFYFLDLLVFLKIAFVRVIKFVQFFFHFYFQESKSRNVNGIVVDVSSITTSYESYLN